MIGRCLAQISSEPESATRPGRSTVTPFLLRMTMVEQQREKLSSITVTTWPDVHWVLRLCNARVRALSYIREPAASLPMARSCTEPPDAWGEDITFVDMDAVNDALGDLHNLIVERYSETRRAWQQAIDGAGPSARDGAQEFRRASLGTRPGSGEYDGLIS